MLRISLIEVPEPAEGTAPVINLAGEAAVKPWLVGSGQLTYSCPKCMHVFAEGMEGPQSLVGLVFHCPGCGIYCRTRT